MSLTRLHNLGLSSYCHRSIFFHPRFYCLSFFWEDMIRFGWHQSQVGLFLPTWSLMWLSICEQVSYGYANMIPSASVLYLKPVLMFCSSDIRNSRKVSLRTSKQIPVIIFWYLLYYNHFRFTYLQRFNGHVINYLLHNKYDIFIFDFNSLNPFV